MRAAGKRLIDFYKSQLGQDVIETGVGAAASAGGQLLLTDMTPEEIALSTALGIGAAAVGRPLIGRTGQAIGTRLSKNPNIDQIARAAIDVNQIPEGILRDAMKAKLAPYANLPAAAQLGQLFGRGYGDNLMQAAVALGTPLFLGDNENNA